MRKVIQFSVIMAMVLVLLAPMGFSADRENFTVTTLRVGTGAQQVSGDGSQILESLVGGTNTIDTTIADGSATATHTTVTPSDQATNTEVVATQSALANGYYKFQITMPNSSNETVSMGEIVYRVDDTASNSEDVAWELWLPVAGTLTKVLDVDANGVALDIVDGSVTNADMSPNSIDSDQYVDGSVDLAHLSANSVDTSKIVDGTVTNADMSPNSIDSDQYIDASIDLAHMSSDSVDTSKIVDGSVTNADLSPNSVDSDQYVDGSIDLAHLSSDSVDTSKIVDGSVTNADLSPNCVDSDQYIDGSIDLIHMSVDSVDSDQYVDASIDREHYADNMAFSGIGGDSIFEIGRVILADEGTSTIINLTYNYSNTNSMFVGITALANWTTNHFVSTMTSNTLVITGDGGHEYMYRVEALRP